MPEKKERIQAAIAGEPVDRPPISMWRHFYDQEITGEGMAQSMLAFQRQYDWDFMKVNPRAQYHVEDWGATFQYPDDPNTGPSATHVPISSPEEWHGIKRLDPHQGTLVEHLRALGTIRKGLEREVPFVMTVFNPLSIAGRMVESQEVMLGHMREHPQDVHAALETITESYQNFVTECLNEGVDGIFFATTTWGTYNVLTDAEYLEFGRPYDLRVLEAVREAEFNILHVCQGNNMLRALADYPVQALNWDSREASNASLEAARTFTGRPFIGGINRETLLNDQPEAVAQEVRDAISQTGGSSFMVGPGCSISPRCSEANLRALHGALTG
ncbi:MAG: uroporphyrinogen decarboxylase family protein [Dehalococcoidia bacterium]